MAREREREREYLGRFEGERRFQGIGFERPKGSRKKEGGVHVEISYF
jgi:hypothetical protein